MPYDVVKVLNAEIEILLAMLRQVQSACWEVDITASGLRIYHSLDARKNGPLAAFLSQQKRRRPELVKLLPAETVAMASVVLAPTPEIVESYADFLRKITAAMGDALAPGTVDSLEKLMKDSIAIMGDEAAFALTTPPPGMGVLSIVETFKVTDAEKMKELTLRAFGEEGAVRQFYQRLGITFDFEKALDKITYKGVEIDALQQNMDFSKWNVPQGPMNMQKMQEKMWGGPMQMKIAFVGNQELLTLGANSLDAIQDMIDRAQGTEGLAGNEAYEVATESFPDDANVVWHVSVERLVQLIGRAMGSAALENVQGGVGVASYSVIDGAAIAGETVVPIEDAILVGETIKNAMAGARRQAMAARQKALAKQKQARQQKAKAKAQGPAARPE